MEKVILITGVTKESSGKETWYSDEYVTRQLDRLSGRERKSILFVHFVNSQFCVVCFHIDCR
jgi:hypothetical protein